jgi:hypothetical protein
VPVRVILRARRSRAYRLDVSIQDVHGFRVTRTLELVAGAGDEPCGGPY